ncbi:hypothetical protein HD806DRAFT_519517 [Xylariaceae sp. AK1471]|nr:hypothetical protein HD806DRAFT_519517 [Xylariaceae sp. AK1471]
MANIRQDFIQGEPTQSRGWQTAGAAATQGLYRGGTEETRSDLEDHRTENDQQHIRQDEIWMRDIPLNDLQPVVILNSYRRCLGLGLSPNLISSPVYYNYDDPGLLSNYWQSRFAQHYLDHGEHAVLNASDTVVGNYSDESLCTMSTCFEQLCPADFTAAPRSGFPCDIAPSAHVQPQPNNYDDVIIPPSVQRQYRYGNNDDNNNTHLLADVDAGRDSSNNISYHHETYQTPRRGQDAPLSSSHMQWIAEDSLNILNSRPRRAGC